MKNKFDFIYTERDSKIEFGQRESSWARAFALAQMPIFECISKEKLAAA